MVGPHTSHADRRQRRRTLTSPALGGLLFALLAGCGTRPTAPPVEPPSDPLPTVKAAADATLAPDLPPADTPIEKRVSPPQLAYDLERELVWQALRRSKVPVADPNMRPIRIWAVESNAGVERIYVIGHADGACCPKVSGALDRVVRRAGYRDALFSFGIARIDAPKGGQATLKRLVDRIERLASESACAGQVDVVRQGFDHIAEAAEDSQDVARRAMMAAREARRPLMLWSDGSPLPLWTPIMALSPDGELEPLSFRLKVARLGIPQRLMRRLSLDGVGQYIAWAQARLAENAREKRDQRERWLMRMPIGELRVESPTLSGRVESLDIEATLTRLQTALADLRRTTPPLDAQCAAFENTVARADAKDAKYREEDLKFVEICRPYVEHAQQGIARNLAAIRTLKAARRAPPHRVISVVVTWLTIRKARDEAEFTKWKTGHDKAMDRLAAERKALKKHLAKAKKAASKPPTDPAPILVDAVLRGWPATFSSARAEREFDRWARRVQPRIWARIREQLADRGIDLGPGDGPGTLQSSATVFHIERKRGTLIIRPHVIVTAGYFMVADPVAGLVRYESAISDENLVGDRRQAEGGEG